MPNDLTKPVNLAQITHSLPAHEHAARSSRHQVHGLPSPTVPATPPQPVVDFSKFRFGWRFSEIEHGNHGETYWNFQESL